MIFAGLLSFIVGIILTAQGSSLNNDISAQMESVFNNGTTDPGSGYIIFGVLFIITGIILFFWGIVRMNNEESNQQQSEKPAAEPAELCEKCGASIARGCKYCSQCGNETKPKEQWTTCAYCGEKISTKSIFCMHCGKKEPIITIKKLCPMCYKDIQPNSAFCMYCGHSFK